jgi:hypothetical protein
MEDFLGVLPRLVEDFLNVASLDGGLSWLVALLDGVR